MKLSRNTVRRYRSGDPEILAERCRSSAFSRLEPFQEEIISLINNKIARKDVYFCIARKGYTGGKTQFYTYCKRLAATGMVDSPGDLKIDELRDGQTKLKYHYVTRNQIFKHIWNGEGNICKDDIEFIKTSFPAISDLSKCLFQFRDIFGQKSKEALSEYIAMYKDCELEPIKKFVEGLEKDIVSVGNAVVEEYSNGFIEGNINKLKVIKRVGYGRCKLPLLRAKIVLPGFFWP
jgi:hypothetical protein